MSAPPAPRRRGSKVLLIVLLVSAGTLIGGGWWAWSSLWPYVRMPDRPRGDIEARWARVERLAVVHATTAEELAAFEPVLEILRALEPPEFATRPVTEGEDPPRQRSFDELPEDWRTFFERLRAWSAGDPQGGWPVDDELRLGAQASKIMLVGVRMDALTDADAEALLRLGWCMRREGRLSDHFVGLQIAHSVNRKQAAADRPVTDEPALMRFAPRTDEVLPTLCRDAVQLLAVVRDGIREGLDEEGWETAQEGEAEKPVEQRHFFADREVVVFKELAGTRLLEMARAGDDLAALTEIARRPQPEDLRSATMSLGLPPAPLVERLEEEYARVLANW